LVIEEVSLGTSSVVVGFVLSQRVRAVVAFEALGSIAAVSIRPGPSSLVVVLEFVAFPLAVVLVRLPSADWVVDLPSFPSSGRLERNNNCQQRDKYTALD